LSPEKGRISMVKKPFWVLTVVLVVGSLAGWVVYEVRNTLRQEKELHVYANCLKTVCLSSFRHDMLLEVDEECFLLRPSWLDAHTECVAGTPVTYSSKFHASQ